MLKNKINRFCFKIVDKVFRPMSKGMLTISLPSGRVMKYGSDSTEGCAHIYVRNMDIFRKCVFYGAIGFGESYVDGDWTTDDLTDVIAWMIHNHENHPTMSSRGSKKFSVNWLHALNIIGLKLRRNSIRGSQRNIMDHYDLGNNFFRTFLDPTMTYSSAYFSDSSKTLEEAQEHKFDQLCQKLKLNSSDHLLEIGTGWGGFAIYAAEHYGCKITTTTISREQYTLAKKRIEKKGLSGQIDVQFCDYRHLDGQYDKIVSIEMIEAVGHKFLQTYFEKCHQLLKEDGLLALQMIQFPDHRYDETRKSIDWIQKYIFPGSLLPSQEAIQKAMKKTGTLGMYDYEDITPHYVKTLKIWGQQFVQNVYKIKDLSKDEIFKRKWIYYFAYCEAAFKMRHIVVGQAIYTRPNNLSLHEPLEVELSPEDQEMLQKLNEDSVVGVR